MVDRPLEGLETAIGRADDRYQSLDAEMIEQCALGGDNIAHGDVGKSWSVTRAGRGIDTRRIGRTVRRSEHVRANGKKAVGVDRLARADDLVPAAFGRRSQGVDQL